MTAKSISDSDFEEDWDRAKALHPIGSLIKGRIISSHAFGLLVDIGFGDAPPRAATGIIEVVASNSLPENRGEWPKIGETIHGEVIFFREHNREIDIRLRKEE